MVGYLMSLTLSKWLRVHVARPDPLSIADGRFVIWRYLLYEENQEESTDRPLQQTAPTDHRSVLNVEQNQPVGSGDTVVRSSRYRCWKHADYLHASHEGTDVLLCVFTSALAAVVRQRVEFAGRWSLVTGLVRSVKIREE